MGISSWICDSSPPIPCAAASFLHGYPSQWQHNPEHDNFVWVTFSLHSTILGIPCTVHSNRRWGGYQRALQRAGDRCPKDSVRLTS